MSISILLQRLTPLLEEATIPYMITGSLGSSVHGTPRSTQDIDIVIHPTRAGLLRLVRALPQDQYYVSEDSALRALANSGQFNVIDYATGWKVDFIIRKNRPFSVTEFDRREVETVQDLALFVARPEDVLLSKLEWAKSGGSKRQLDDAAGILQAQGEKLDREYLERWARELEVVEELEKVSQMADPSKK